MQLASPFATFYSMLMVLTATDTASYREFTHYAEAHRVRVRAQA